MIIEELNLPAPSKRSMTKESRCSRVVRSTSTGVWNEYHSRCCRHATYSLDGVKLCSQHAGEMALRHLILSQRSEIRAPIGWEQ